MIDTIFHYTKMIIFVCIGVWLVWQGITHAGQVAHVLVTVIDAIKLFFTTLFNGVF